MYSGELIVMALSIAAFTLNNVMSRPSPDSPIKYPDEPPNKNIEPAVRSPTRSRRPTPSSKPTSYRNYPVCADRRSTFCENVTNYPSHDELYNSMAYSREQFIEIFGPVDLHPKSRVKEEDLADERICSQQTKIFYPKAAKNEDDQWMFVVNDVNYVQMVISEICEVEDSACLYIDNNLPAGFGSRCRQLFAHKRLLALGPSDKKTHIASFRFPSCCVCFVRYPIGWTQSRSKALT